MPLYDLKCTSSQCRHEFEEFHKLDEVEKAKCPKCGKKAKRLITLVTPKHLSWSKWRMDHGS